MALVQGLDSKAKPRGIKSTDGGELKVHTANGATTTKQDSIIAAITLDQSLYGASLTDRPDADAVTVGKTFVLVDDPLVVYISDGSTWLEV